MIKNIIFDFGNVLFEFDPSKMVIPYVSDPSLREEVAREVGGRHYWAGLDMGTLRDADVIKGLRSTFSGELAEQAVLSFSNWLANAREIPGSRELIARLRKEGYKIYLLSNISIDFALNYGKVPAVGSLLDTFDGLVFSGPIHMIKPNRDIYMHLLEKYGLKAEECIFTDDLQMNTDGAEACGIKGHVFTGAEELGAFIDSLKC